MRRPIKAALLSGLVFPGAGHMFLKQYLRSFALMLSAVIALSVLVAIAMQEALVIVDRINSGELALESGAIAELVSNATSSAESTVSNIATAILGACWLIGIIDSCRRGITQEK